MDRSPLCALSRDWQQTRDPGNLPHNTEITPNVQPSERAPGSTVCILFWWEVWQIRLFLLPHPTGAWQMQSTFCEPMQPRGGAQSSPSNHVGRPGPPGACFVGNACFVATGAVASSALRRDPLLSISSLSIRTWGCGAAGPQAEEERRAAALLLGLPFNMLITNFHIPYVLQPKLGSVLGPKGARGRVPGPGGASEPLKDYAGNCRTHGPTGSSG